MAGTSSSRSRRAQRVRKVTSTGLVRLLSRSDSLQAVRSQFRHSRHSTGQGQCLLPCRFPVQAWRWLGMPHAWLVGPCQDTGRKTCVTEGVYERGQLACHWHRLSLQGMSQRNSGQLSVPCTRMAGQGKQEWERFRLAMPPWSSFNINAVFFGKAASLHTAAQTESQHRR